MKEQVPSVLQAFRTAYTSKKGNISGRHRCMTRIVPVATVAPLVLNAIGFDAETAGSIIQKKKKRRDQRLQRHSPMIPSTWNEEKQGRRIKRKRGCGAARTAADGLTRRGSLGAAAHPGRDGSPREVAVASCSFLSSSPPGWLPAPALRSPLFSLPLRD